jgi:hypothetical protein
MDLNKKNLDILTWTAPNHVQPKRSPTWYMVFLIISLGLIAYAVYTQSIITGITFLLIIVVVLVLSSRGHELTTYQINKTGVSVGNISYPYKIIKKFWIYYNPPEVKTVNLETSAYLNNRVILQLGKQDPVAVKLLLSKFIPEDLDKQESLSETMARRLKI